MKKAFLLIILLSLSGCITTSIKDFTDPDYVRFTAHKMLLLLPNEQFNELFTHYFERRSNLEVVSIDDLFLPTRTYSDKEKKKVVDDMGFDSYLVISVTGDNSSVDVVSYKTRSSAIAYGNNNYATANGASTTTPVKSYNRSTAAKITLYDATNQRIVWVGELKTSAGGSLYMSNSGTISSMAKKSINSLINKGHVEKRQQ